MARASLFAINWVLLFEASANGFPAQVCSAFDVSWEISSRTESAFAINGPLIDWNWSMPWHRSRCSRVSLRGWIATSTWRKQLSCDWPASDTWKRPRPPKSSRRVERSCELAVYLYSGLGGEKSSYSERSFEIKTSGREQEEIRVPRKLNRSDLLDLLLRIILRPVGAPSSDQLGSNKLIRARVVVVNVISVAEGLSAVMRQTIWVRAKTIDCKWLNYGVLLQPPVRHVPEEPQRGLRHALLGLALSRLVLVELPAPALERGSVSRRCRRAAAVCLLSAPAHVPSGEPRLGRPRELCGPAPGWTAAAARSGQQRARRPRRLPVHQPGHSERRRQQRAHQRRPPEPALAAHHRLGQRHEQSRSAQRIVVASHPLAADAREKSLRVDEEAVIPEPAEPR